MKLEQMLLLEVMGVHIVQIHQKKIHELDSFYSFFTKSYTYSIDDIWSDKNKINPKKLSPKSDKKAWWKCQNKKHKDYERSLANSFLYDFRCPECVRENRESLLQEKVREFITSLGYHINHEFNCELITINPKTLKRLPYDNEIIELKLVIEVHGQQHYHVEGFNRMKSKRESTSPKEELKYRQVLDRFKRIKAKINGYDYLEIPYWTNDKQETWKKIILNKIKYIKQQENTEVIL
ncbi:TPA: zinc-ribbon domain-containing protein [Clostridium perfringens]